jgi:hypothetical protein
VPTRIVRVRARPLIDALARLEDAGARLPTFTVGRVRVAYSAVPERLHATIKNKRIGTLTRGGLFRPVKGATPLQIASVKTLVENPIDVARGAAILLGFEATCPICGRVLDSKDRLRGIGPACYEKGEFWRLETKQSLRARKIIRRKDNGKKRRIKRQLRGHEG